MNRGVIGKGRSLSGSDFDIRLMQQSGSTQSQRHPLAGQFTSGNTVQLGIKRTEKRVRRRSISALSGLDA
jgi:hypothetical protein